MQNNYNFCSISLTIVRSCDFNRGVSTFDASNIAIDRCIFNSRLIGMFQALQAIIDRMFTNQKSFLKPSEWWHGLWHPISPWLNSLSKQYHLINELIRTFGRLVAEDEHAACVYVGGSGARGGTAAGSRRSFARRLCICAGSSISTSKSGRLGGRTAVGGTSIGKRVRVRTGNCVWAWRREM